MSVSHNTYLGPYFRCRTRTGTVEKTITCCPNIVCRRYGEPSHSMNFCPACGTELDRWDRMPTTEPHWSDVSEAIQEALSEVTTDDADFGKEWHIWVPNVTRPDQPVRDADDKCGVEVAVDDLDIGAEKRWLVEAFNKELGVLRSMYGGADKVEIRWGLVKYCS